MKKLFILTLSLSLLLISCQKSDQTEENTSTDQKQSFIIKTKKLSDFSGDFSAEKSAIIQSSSELTLQSEGNGIIQKIYVKEGDFVKEGAIIASIKDTLNNYDLSLKQAKNNLSLQEASNETTKINLQNAVNNAKIAYDQALLNYNNLRSKNSLKYDTLVQENNITKKTYNDAYKNFLNSLDGMMTQYLYEADKVLGMTDEWEWGAKAWEPYLGAKVGDALSISKNEWNVLYGIRGEIRKRIDDTTPFTDSDTNKDLELITRAYNQIRKFSDAMIFMFQYSIIGDRLTQEINNGWITQWNGFRSAGLQSENAFIAWKTPASTFLENYKNTETATKIASESQGRKLSVDEQEIINQNKSIKIAYENTNLQMNDALSQAKITLRQAEDAVENAKQVQNATIKQLSLSTENARLAVLQAERNAQKLTIKAPISGTITKITAEIGQNITTGTLVAEMSSKEAQSVVEIDPRMALMLSEGQKVQAKIDDTTIEGKITAISPIASANLQSTVRIAFPRADKLIGRPAVIIFDIPNELKRENSYLIPVNIVQIIAQGEGRISTYRNGQIQQESVQLGNMYGKNIEIFVNLPEDTKIIENDTTQFDSHKNTLVEQDSNL